MISSSASWASASIFLGKLERCSSLDKLAFRKWTSLTALIYPGQLRLVGKLQCSPGDSPDISCTCQLDVPGTRSGRHGKLAIAKRWAAKYPDILGADDSGRRQNSSEHQVRPRFCFASEFLCNNLYLDAEAFLTGKPASSRGLDAWNPTAFQPGFFNLSLPANAQNCYCEKCQRFYQNRKESERF